LFINEQVFNKCAGSKYDYGDAESLVIPAVVNAPKWIR